MGTKLFFRPKTIFANNVLILKFRNLKFPELENWELEVPGTWELWNLATSKLGNLFKDIPIISRSIKFGVIISKLGQGVFLAARRIATGSGFEHAGGTPLPISKASIPPPPPPPPRQQAG